MGWSIASDRIKAMVGHGIEGSSHLVCRGALVFEMCIRPADLHPRRVVRMVSDAGWSKAFILYLNADGSVSIENRQGESSCYARVSPPSGSIRRLRVTYQWDGPSRVGTLAAECLETGSFNQAIFADPVPLPAQDIRDICLGAVQGAHDPILEAAAFSKFWQKIGPRPTIAAGSLIDTPDGARPIDTLRLGDLVTTRQHGDRPIRWIVSERRPNVGFDRPVSLRAPYLGLDQSLVVSGRQLVEVPLDNIDYSLGQSDAFVEAGAFGGRLINEDFVSGLETLFYQLLLDDHDCVRANGLWCESLFVGALARSPEALLSTHFGAVGARGLPVHMRPAARRLEEHETTFVMDQLTA